MEQMVIHLMNSATLHERDKRDGESCRQLGFHASSTLALHWQRPPRTDQPLQYRQRSVSETTGSPSDLICTPILFAS